MSATLTSARAKVLAHDQRHLALDLRALAGGVSPELWESLRPLAEQALASANDARELAEDLERSEALEAVVIQAAGEAGHGATRGHGAATG